MRGGAVSFRVSATDEVAARMKVLGYRSSDLRKVFDQLGAEVVADARSLAPRRSGALASSIHADVWRSGVTVNSGLAYTGVQEYGWRRRNIQPHLFLTTAADSKADAAAEDIAAETQRLINAVGLG